MAACKVCNDPLIMEIEDDDGGDPQSVPDDLELRACGCHFHWQCFLDQSAEVAISLKCPSCGAQLAANQAGPSVTNPFLRASPGVSVLTRYTSEGGVDEDLDILPTITEEAYVAANPGTRPARAYHVMCAEGDVEGIIDLLRDAEQQQEEGDLEGEEPPLNPTQIIRYQDPLAGNQSGLHLAVERGQEEVVWLLLWMASSLPARVFPEAAVQAAQAMGIQRPGAAVPPAEDIRALQDDRGRTAEALAIEVGRGAWAVALHPGNSS